VNKLYQAKSLAYLIWFHYADFYIVCSDVFSITLTDK